MFSSNLNADDLYFHCFSFCPVLRRYFGIRNMIYLAFAGSLWWATDSYTSFFVLTSFVHYVR